jgi:hypothetical protein
MNQIEIHNQLIELEFLSHKLNFIDDFTDLYERMLSDCLLRRDRITPPKLKAILLKQVGFLSKALLEAGLEEGILQ